MSLMACRSCSTRFAVGLLRCPQCQAVSEIYARPGHEADAEEENMPKITVGGGASNALADTETVPDVAAAGADETVVTETEPVVSDGASVEDVPPESETAPAKPARKTATKKATPAAQ